MARLKGLDCEGENEPSHALIDRAFASFSGNQFNKIEWKDSHFQARPFTGLYEALGFLNAILIHSVTFSSSERRGTKKAWQVSFRIALELRQ